MRGRRRCDWPELGGWEIYQSRRLRRFRRHETSINNYRLAQKREIGRASKKNILSIRCEHQWCQTQVGTPWLFFPSSLNTCIFMYTNLFAFKCPTNAPWLRSMQREISEQAKHPIRCFSGPSARFPLNFISRKPNGVPTNLGHVYPFGQQSHHFQPQDIWPQCLFH